MIYGYVDDHYDFSRIRMNFGSNVGPAGINNGLHAHLKSSIGKLGTYSELLAETLAARIEQQKGIPTGTVLVTNLYEKKRALIYTSSFSEYEDACYMYGHSVEFMGFLS